MPTTARTPALPLTAERVMVAYFERKATEAKASK